MKKIKISGFIGRQLSRLKMGLIYYAMGMSSITAIGILKIAFPQISIWMFILLIPFILFGAFLIGYIMDKSDIVAIDQQKTIEMAHRYLNINDFKSNEFRIVLMKAIFKWMESIQKGEPIDFKDLDTEYKKFVKKWDSPENK